MFWVCIPFFYYAPEAIVTMLVLQVLEISRVAVKECYSMALIKVSSKACFKMFHNVAGRNYHKTDLSYSLITPC